MCMSTVIEDSSKYVSRHTLWYRIQVVRGVWTTGAGFQNNSVRVLKFPT